MVRGALLSVALLLLSSFAAAQSLDPAAAEVLFAEGRRAMDDEDFETACRKFAESHRLDPAPGTVINLAECLDKQGKIASSWQRWKEARRMLRPGDDRQWAVEHRIKQIEGRLPHLEIQLEKDAPPGTVIRRDEVVLGMASVGLRLPVDPGKHVVIVRAPDREESRYEIEIEEGETKTLEVAPGALVKAGEPVPAGGPLAQGPEPQASAPAAPVRDEGAPGGEPGRRTAAFVAGGIGAASLVVGGVFGILAIGKKGEMDEDCSEIDGRVLCGTKGLDAADSGKTFATVANVGVAVGIIGLGVGAYLLITASGEGGEQTAVVARPSPGGGSVGLVSSF